MWEELGLPPLKPESRWYGSALGNLCDELDKEALLPAQGGVFLVGERPARRHVKGRMPNEGAWPEAEGLGD